MLICGCEVSLWVGEQFASDLHNAFPQLKVVTLSSNKILAQLGQAFPQPQTGFCFNETSYKLANSPVMLITHSGGTCATLNIANLPKGYTKYIFCVTSEWDTQVARAVRAGPPGKVKQSFDLASYVFITFCGCRPAEPCSLSVAATHQLLTNVLLYLMYSMRYYHGDKYPDVCDSHFDIEEVRELEMMNRDTLTALRQLRRPVERRRRRGAGGKHVEDIRAAPCSGGALASHILEGPISWIISATHIAVTVTAGYTPLSLLVKGSSAAPPAGAATAAGRPAPAFCRSWSV